MGRCGAQHAVVEVRQLALDPFLEVEQPPVEAPRGLSHDPDRLSAAWDHRLQRLGRKHDQLAVLSQERLGIQQLEDRMAVDRIETVEQRGPVANSATHLERDGIAVGPLEQLAQRSREPGASPA